MRSARRSPKSIQRAGAERLVGLGVDERSREGLDVSNDEHRVDDELAALFRAEENQRAHAEAL
jgi:hypothetical protein